MNEDVGTGEPWVTVRNLGFFHGNNRILDDINLDFYPGRHYIVAGPNGAGKSTFLDIVANLRKPATGAVTVMGRPLSEYTPVDLARRLALAPQEYRLNFPFTIREVVAMGRRPYLGQWGILGEADYRIVDEAIGRLHLTPLAGRAVTALSGGERRRCVVARTLAQTTPIVLLDEPSAGLDIAQALSLMSLAKELAAAGALVITVSHDLNLAAAFGHHLVFLKDGAVAATGTVAEVFTDAVIGRVYDTEARVSHDEFTGGQSVSFRLSRFK